MHKAGARLFCVGFESGDVEVINGMKKNNDDRRDAKYHEEAHRFVRRCQDAGIMVHGCFMVGNLNETPASMEKTLSFAKKLRPDTAQFFPIMVYPGTVAYQEAKKREYIQIEDWGAWLTKDGLHNSVVTLPNITHEQLVSFCDQARRSFYLESLLSCLQVEAIPDGSPRIATQRQGLCHALEVSASRKRT